jgi:tryptophan synthase alpha chain
MSLSKGLQREVLRIKRLTKKYVLVGFGISTSSHVREILSVSDGAIVGSAILNVLRKHKNVMKALSFTQSLLRGVPQ